MKIGDSFPVTVQGITVGTATVEHVEADRVTIAFPATRFVAKTKTQLTDEGPEPSGTEHIVTGVDVRPSATVETPVVETETRVEPVANNDNSA